MTRNTRCRGARGFALVEMLFCIVATSMIVMICGRLFQQIARVYREVPEAMNTILSDEQWLRQIRADVWTSSGVTLEENGVLILRTSDATVRWSPASDYLRREESGLVTQWPAANLISFKREGGLLLVQSEDASIALAQANRGGE